jgi:hypothetical protein
MHYITVVTDRRSSRLPCHTCGAVALRCVSDSWTAAGWSESMPGADEEDWEIAVKARSRKSAQSPTTAYRCAAFSPAHPSRLLALTCERDNRATPLAATRLAACVRSDCESRRRGQIFLESSRTVTTDVTLHHDIWCGNAASAEKRPINQSRFTLSVNCGNRTRIRRLLGRCHRRRPESRPNQPRREHGPSSTAAARSSIIRVQESALWVIQSRSSCANITMR